MSSGVCFSMHPPKSVLVTGGAGYIGSHTVLAFQDAGDSVVVLDDLSNGRRDAVPEDVPFVEGNAGDSKLLGEVFQQHGVHAVIHFAGSIVVPESVSDPLKYYFNNTSVSRNLIQACVEHGVKNFIFSSTAAVYGNPSRVPAREDDPTEPINPYGASKLMTERILIDTAAAHDFRYAALRYFNVAGADPQLRTGQSTPNATHLIKIASEVAAGKRDFMEVFGDDYDTPDGTCIRDYIHVADLANAHVAALGYLDAGNNSVIANCGYGQGFSVREVLGAVEKVSGTTIDARIAPRRPGDAKELIADSGRIRRLFDWDIRYDDLEFIVKTAMDW